MGGHHCSKALGVEEGEDTVPLTTPSRLPRFLALSERGLWRTKSSSTPRPPRGAEPPPSPAPLPSPSPHQMLPAAGFDFMDLSGGAELLPAE